MAGNTGSGGSYSWEDFTNTVKRLSASDFLQNVMPGLKAIEGGQLSGKSGCVITLQESGEIAAGSVVQHYATTAQTARSGTY
jgi:hypothetical protein